MEKISNGTLGFRSQNNGKVGDFEKIVEKYSKGIASTKVANFEIVATKIAKICQKIIAKHGAEEFKRLDLEHIVEKCIENPTFSRSFNEIERLRDKGTSLEKTFIALFYELEVNGNKNDPVAFEEQDLILVRDDHTEYNRYHFMGVRKSTAFRNLLEMIKSAEFMKFIQADKNTLELFNSPVVKNKNDNNNGDEHDVFYSNRQDKPKQTSNTNPMVKFVEEAKQRDLEKIFELKLEQNLTALQYKHQRLEEELQQTEVKLKRVQGYIATEENKHHQAQEEYGRLSKYSDLLNGQKSQLQAEIERIKQKLNPPHSNSSNELYNNVKGKLFQAKQVLGTLHQQEQKLAQDKVKIQEIDQKELNTKIEQKNNEIAILEAQLSRLEENLKNLNQACSRIEGTNSQLEQEAQQYKDTLNQLKAVQATTQQQAAEIKQLELEIRRQKAQDLRNYIDCDEELLLWFIEDLEKVIKNQRYYSDKEVNFQWLYDMKEMWQHKKLLPANFIIHHPHILTIVKLKNGTVLAAYSEEEFQEEKIKAKGNQKAYLWSLTDKKRYDKCSAPERATIANDDYYIVYGNSEFRIGGTNDNLYSNFGVVNGVFDSKGKKLNDFLKSGDKIHEAQMEQYACFQVEI